MLTFQLVGLSKNLFLWRAVSKNLCPLKMARAGIGIQSRTNAHFGIFKKKREDSKFMLVTLPINHHGLVKKACVPEFGTLPQQAQTWFCWCGVNRPASGWLTTFVVHHQYHVWATFTRFITSSDFFYDSPYTRGWIAQPQRLKILPKVHRLERRPDIL